MSPPGILDMAADSSSSSARAERSPDRPVAQPPRYKYACEACHSSKVRCTGKQPCARCTTNGWECVYKLAARIGKPKGSRNKATIQRLRLEAEQQATREARTSPITTLPMPSPLHYQSATAQLTADGSAAAFDSPFSTTPLSSTSTHQDWIWSADSNIWPRSPESMRTPSVPNHAVSSPESQWDSIIDGEGSSTSRSLSDATVPIGGIALSSWGSEYNTTGDPRGAEIPSTIQELYPGAQALAYSMGELPSSTFMPQTSAYDPSILATALVTDDRRQPASLGMWTSADGIMRTFPTTPPGGPATCSCKRNLSWQLNRLDHLRKAMTPGTTAHDFLQGSSELRGAVAVYLSCQICEKDASTLSLMTTAFANFTHVLLSTVRTGINPVSQTINQDPYTWLGTTADSAGVNAEPSEIQNAQSKMLVQQWIEECEVALQVVHSVTVAVEPPAPSLASHTLDTGQQHREEAKAANISWSPADPSSMDEMLWRVKQSLTNLV